MDKKRILLIMVIVILIALIGVLVYGYYKKLTNEVKNPIVTMEIADYGTIKIELYPDKAPNTVKNFISLINRGYYNNLTFHRTVPGFMIQGGDINGDGSGNLEYNIPGEFIANGYKENDLRHEKGVISMARSNYGSMDSSLLEEGYNSAGAQFFIMDGDASYLDGYYAAFGKVIESLDIVEKIANLEVTYRQEELGADEEPPKDEEGNALVADKPLNPPVITNMSVETFGIEYGEPEKIEPFDYNTWFMQTYANSF